MTKPLPNSALLRKLLRYDRKTGLMTWRERPVEMFNDTSGRTAGHSCAIWNSKNAGNEALASADGNGYLFGTIFGRLHRAHRVIWALETGAWPEKQIDHRNHIGTDNRWDNLREVTHAENQKNQTLPVNNTSGVMGVMWHKRAKKWAALIALDGKKHHLGYFTDKQDAIDARAAAEIKYGFHANHGNKAHGTDTTPQRPLCGRQQPR